MKKKIIFVCFNVLAIYVFFDQLTYLSQQISRPDSSMSLPTNTRNDLFRRLLCSPRVMNKGRWRRSKEDTSNMIIHLRRGSNTEFHIPRETKGLKFI
uniref:Uncharacterized protein n=1 Tax=Lepeophtheirus salmonis TaxID=72036 RepID=A0A0K2U3P3_LEPSM